MSNVNIIATLHVANEVKEIVKNKMKELVVLSQAESGCIKYEFNEVGGGIPGVENTGGEFVVIETWKDLSALEAHSTSVHFSEFINNFDESELKITLQVINLV